MGLFRASAPTSVQVSDAGTPLRVTAAATGKPWNLWADGLGTFAIRALQILLAVLLIAAVMIGIIAKAIPPARNIRISAISCRGVFTVRSCSR